MVFEIKLSIIFTEKIIEYRIINNLNTKCILEVLEASLFHVTIKSNKSQQLTEIKTAKMFLKGVKTPCFI